MSKGYSTFAEQVKETCPDARKHTKGQLGLSYLEWHAWAEKKSKTHDNVQCPTCGKYAIWKKKPEAPQ